MQNIGICFCKHACIDCFDTTLQQSFIACTKGETYVLLCIGEMLASRREKKEEYIAAPAILGETSILAGCLQELATRHAVTVPSMLRLLLLLAS